MKRSVIFSFALFTITGLAGYTQVSSVSPVAENDVFSSNPAMAQADAANQYRYQIAQSAPSSGGFGSGMMGGMGMSGFGGGFGRSDEKQEVRVFALKFYNAGDMVGILRDVSPIGAVPDMRNNQLIVTGTPDQLSLVTTLIEAIDKESTQEQRVAARFNLLYRIYMVEQEVEESNWRPFTVTLRMTAKPLDTTIFNQELNSESLILTDINSVRSGTQLVNNSQVEITDTVFEGKATSLNDLKAFIEKIHNFTNEVPEIRSFQMEDRDSSTQDNSSNAHEQLPDNVKGHLEKLLGDSESLSTVGYWFGNSSNTGTVTAPVGEWSVTLQSMYTDNNNLDLEIHLSGGNQRGGRTISGYNTLFPESYPRTSSSPDQLYYSADADAALTGTTTPRRIHRYTNSNAVQPGAMVWAGSSNSTILQNTVKSQIGKPIIIGYNRETGNGRRMGALVIVPDMDELTGSNLQTN